MKILLLFFLLIPFSGSFAQMDTMATLKLDLRNCNKSNKTFGDRDTIWLFDLYSSKARTVLTIPNYNGEFNKIIVPAGKYCVWFRNIFNQLVRKDISVAAKKLNNHTFCIDSLDSYPQQTLHQLKDQDSIVINIQSNGCFHQTFERIVITRDKEKYVARTLSVPTVAFRNKPNNNIKESDYVQQNKIVMNAAQMLAFRKFENELSHIPTGFCTTNDTYNIRSKYLNIDVDDGSCRWNGYKHLYESLFGEKK